MNTIIPIIIYAVVVLAAAVNLLSEMKRDLMMMQQNSYRTDRYMRWLRASGDTTSTFRIIGMLVTLMALARFGNPIWSMAAIGLFTAVSAVSLGRRKYKKPLVWTPRARRIYGVMSLISAAIIIALVFLTGSNVVLPLLFAVAATMTGLYCASHVLSVSAVWLLGPVERAINRRYYNEAADILRSMPDLKIIGVTGSYGKTSTKHYLHRILSEEFDVLMTPGSYNTTLGVIRTVREMMKPYTRVFICEMGAKQPGDVKEICDLVHPSVGIVTAVGPQHLESFKSMENVQRTKFELIDSLPADGLAVVNNDFPYVASRKVQGVECLRYGVAASSEDVDFRAVDISYDASGTTFTIIGYAEPLTLHTRLVGECNVSNLMAAVIVAVRLGVPRDKIRYAVEKIEQVEHRLNVKRTAGGITIIDDAFNSNPTGSAMALDVLAAMKGGKRIVVTPGMIELGERQEELNRKFGGKIAESADVAIIVGEYNREAITDGITSVASPAVECHCVPTFAAAQQMLSAMLHSGDTVLYENDLPDTFK